MTQKRVSEILSKYDPLGLNKHGQKDEYEGESKEILEVLNCMDRVFTPHWLVRLKVWEIFYGWNCSSAGEEAKYDDIAQELWTEFVR